MRDKNYSDNTQHSYREDDSQNDTVVEQFHFGWEWGLADKDSFMAHTFAFLEQREHGHLTTPDRRVVVLSRSLRTNYERALPVRIRCCFALKLSSIRFANLRIRSSQLLPLTVSPLVPMKNGSNTVATSPTLFNFPISGQ